MKFIPLLIEIKTYQNYIYIQYFNLRAEKRFNKIKQIFSTFHLSSSKIYKIWIFSYFVDSTRR